jgi:hypothetical protein
MLLPPHFLFFLLGSYCSLFIVNVSRYCSLFIVTM